MEKRSNNQGKKARNSTPSYSTINIIDPAAIQAQHQELLLEAKKYNANSLEAFINQKPNLNDSEDTIERHLLLQETCRRHLEQKQIADKTIIIEPAKLHEAVEKAEDILAKKGDIYQRAGTLVRLTSNDNSLVPKKCLVKRPNDTLIIHEIDIAYLSLLLNQCCRFFKRTKNSKLYPIDCPEKIARYLLSKKSWRIQQLVAVINAPTLRLDGSILEKPGYDEASGLLFLEQGTIFNSIPDRPTQDDAKNSLQIILNLLQGFPFENEVAKSVACAAILTALVRRSLRSAPLIGFTAPKMGSGKSLLADVVSLIAIGTNNSVITQVDSETEERKRLLSILLAGDSIICYDNIEKPLESSALCAVLTQQEFKDRILGTNTTKTVHTNTTFLATGNNLVFLGDLSTRAILCRLDPKMEHPEERHFEIDLKEYIPLHRAEIVRAGLTILRAYWVAGRPTQYAQSSCPNEQPMKIREFGRFEDWSKLIRSTLIWMGMSDPCESRKEITTDDPQRQALVELFSSWHELFGEMPKKAKDIIQGNAHDNPTASVRLVDAICDLLNVSDPKFIQPRTFAKKLARFKGRIESGLRLEQVGTNQGTALWRVAVSDQSNCGNVGIVE